MTLNLPTLLRLSIKSLINRRLTVFLSVLTIAFSVALLLTVERVRTEARTSFNQTISGTDLIVGAPSGDIQLLLYSVFQLGNASANMSWKAAQEIAAMPEVAWTLPLALGDSHKGYRVMGTDAAYFDLYKYGRKQPLSFAGGEPFADLYQAVVGAEVAQKLGYQVGDKIVIAHGMGRHSFKEHDDKPFTLVGVLERTGTPVDRSVLVSLQSIEAIHIGWGKPALSDIRARFAEKQGSTAQPDAEVLQPEAITALLVGVKKKTQLFKLQRRINEGGQGLKVVSEPLQAVMPAVALQQLWKLVGVAENALLVVAGFVVISGLVGLMSVILTGLNERRREIAILRAIGARPMQVMLLLVAEAFILTLLGLLLGAGVFYLLLLVAAPWVYEIWGIWLPVTGFSLTELKLLSIIAFAGLLVGLWPGMRAYRISLAEGLSVRL